MGQLLSQPITSKSSERYENESYLVAMSCMQGWRVSMEDAHTIMLNLPGYKSDSFFGVFDGHGGFRVADYVSLNLLQHILKQSDYESCASTALAKGFVAVDAAIRANPEFEGDTSGSTGNCVLVRDNKIYCANTGDSRAVASVAGVTEPLSVDHKPTDEREYNRILYAGGWVEYNRVNGNLALSRAFGDFEFKRNSSAPPEEQIITCMPDVTVREVTPDLEFIVIACDGIWDVLTSAEVGEFVRNRIAQAMDPVQIMEDLLNRCLAPDCQMSGLGCDNMTALLICFLQGDSYKQLAARCSRPPGQHASQFTGSVGSR